AFPVGCNLNQSGDVAAPMGSCWTSCVTTLRTRPAYCCRHSVSAASTAPRVVSRKTLRSFTQRSVTGRRFGVFRFFMTLSLCHFAVFPHDSQIRSLGRLVALDMK